MFELDQVGVEVEGRALLHPITLSLPPGRVIGLIGHNGSGKSTLVKLLARQMLPTTGSIAFEGKALDQWDSRGLARRLAYLPQQSPQTVDMLVKELVALGRYPWRGALSWHGAEDRKKVAHAMEATGTAPFAERMVDTLSGGERQRVWLAMLIAQEPQYLLLDEPISALDIAHQMDVLALIRQLSDRHGLSVLMVLHDVNLAARFCEEILALQSGRLIARGAPDTIMTTDRLRTIYGLDFGIMRHPDTGGPVSYVR